MRLLLLFMMLFCGNPAAWARDQSRRPTAAPDPDPDPDEGCSGGPASWCRSLATAARCGALRLCLLRQGGRGGLVGHGEESCRDCKQVVILLLRLVKESRFQKAVRTYLEGQCEALPLQTLVPRCQELVDSYYDLFVARLEGQVKPDLLCAKVGLCSSDPLEPPDVSSPLSPELEKILWPQQGQDPILPNSQAQGSPGEEFPIPLPTCWICRKFAGQVESLIPKETISKSMSQLCHLLPLTLTGMCECMVEKYSVILVQILVNKLGPDLICGLLNMCATDENCGQEMPHGAPPVPVDRCQTCLGISDQVKAALTANSSREEVEVALILACAKTSFLDWQECESFLRRHQGQLVRLLQKPWDSKTTCQELGDCVAREESSATSIACAQGPAYWCSSLRTAEECKAIQHCQAHVWL